jgi:hypothetical protein
VRPTIIVFTGRKFSGKDYLAENTLMKDGYQRISFSDELKHIAHFIYPWLPVDIPSEQKEVPYPAKENINNMTPREIWMSLDKLREVDPKVFIYGVLKKLTEHDKIIVTDLRKKPEYNMLKLFAEQYECRMVFIRLASQMSVLNADHSEDEIDDFEVDYDFWHTMEGPEDFKEFLKKIV